MNAGEGELERSTQYITTYRVLVSDRNPLGGLPQGLYQNTFTAKDDETAEEIHNDLLRAARLAEWVKVRQGIEGHVTLQPEELQKITTETIISRRT